MPYMLYLNNLEHNHGITKLDFMNIFNSIQRDKMLVIISFCLLCVFQSLLLVWNEKILQSAKDVQQRSPRLLLFCLCIHQMCFILTSDLCVCYQDNLTFGGSLEVLVHDIYVVEQQEYVHNAILLLHHSQFLFCSYFLFFNLLNYNNLLISIVSSITNITFLDDHPA